MLSRVKRPQTQSQTVTVHYQYLNNSYSKNATCLAKWLHSLGLTIINITTFTLPHNKFSIKANNSIHSSHYSFHAFLHFYDRFSFEIALNYSLWNQLSHWCRNPTRKNHICFFSNVRNSILDSKFPKFTPNWP